MMEQMKQRQGGNLSGGKGAQQPGPQGGQQPGPQAPKTQAEQLKTSLEGIRQSAVYLMNSKFVK
jgi:hypothetical protein